MSVSRLSSAGLDPRRKRILFRAWRRGLREMDLALGQFADANLAALKEGELAEVERWLDLPDPDILAWITAEAPIPANYDTPLFARLCAAPATAARRGRGGS